MNNNGSKKFYDSAWFIVVCFGSVVLIPLGIFLVWRDKSINKSLKIISSLISGIAFLSLSYCVVQNFILKPNNSSPSIPSSIQDILDDIKESSVEEDYSSGPEEAKEQLYKPPVEEFAQRYILQNSASAREEESEKDSNEQTAKSEETTKSSDENKAIVHTENDQTEKEQKDNTHTENKSSKDTTKNTTTETKKTETKSNIVYVTPKGKKYHVKNPCGKGKFSAINIDEAINKGYTPCKKCVK